MKIHNAKLTALLEDIAGRIATCDYIWELPWRGINSRTWPINAVTGKHYSGSNILTLYLSQLLQDRPGNWATYKQWSAAGRQVKKGSVGTPILWFQMVPVKDSEDGELKPRWKYPTVFNETQLEDFSLVDEDYEPPVFDLERYDLAKRFIENCGAKTGTARSAYYQPSNDTVFMPEKELFKATNDGTSALENYVSTYLHELCHWTMHKDRLNRKLDKAAEECVVEIASVLLCVHLGISPAIRDTHMSYVKHWGEDLRENPNLFISWSRQASKCFEYLLSLQPAEFLSEITNRHPDRNLCLTEIEYENAA
ncbi:MAG: ArdC family protein [Maricaulaceae bacterium]